VPVLRGADVRNRERGEHGADHEASVRMRRVMQADAARRDQAAAIRRATLKSFRARNAYAEHVVADMRDALAAAEKDIARAILQYKSLGSLPDRKLAALKGLETLQGELGEITGALGKEHTLRFRRATKEAFTLGIGAGIGELADAALPLYQDLTPQGIGKLSTKVFTLVDTDALDFMANYNLVLAGGVHRELADGIKRTILSGIATGKSAEEIARDLGTVVKDPEAFRHAGGRVFAKAQHRMETIARTEVLRAHNQGRIKFHDQVGVRKLEWMTMLDERVCPVCGPLDGKVFETGKFPPQPAHPNCRCTHVVAWPVEVCGPGGSATASGNGGEACIVPPQAIEAQAKEKSEEEKKLKTAFESGEPGQLAGLTMKQLQALAKQNGVSVARTKADHLKLLGQAEPGIDHSGLGGAALEAKLKQHGIGALRTKEEMLKLLQEKQAALKQGQQVAEQMKKLPEPGGLEGFTVSDLQEMAKGKGISLHMTKQDVINALDELEPGVDHGGLSGQSLAEAKQKAGIGALKNKKQLVKALEKSAGEALAEQAKQEALDTAKKAAAAKAQQAVDEATSKVVVPPAPAGYAAFLDSVKKAEEALAQGGALPQAVLEQHAKDVALKKKLFADQIGAMKQSQLKDLAKETKLKHWQWASKDELVAVFSETDPAKVAAAKEGIAKKHAAWAEKHGGGKKKAGAPAAPQVEKEAPSAPQTPPAAPKPPAPPAPPVPSAEPPKPEPSKPVFSKKASEFDAVDEAWKTTGKPENFKFQSVARVGGAHEKEFWIGPDGEKWLFKPVKRAGDSFLAEGDEVAYRIGRLVDPEAIEVRSIRLNGRMGSIQKWRTDLAPKFDFDGVDPERLSPREIEQLQREHVIDWLLANHDGHAKQFLRAKDGRVFGIDKGQLFKHLGSDRLAADYHPNAVHGEKEPYYNTLFRAVKAGKAKVDPAVTLRYVREVEKLSDADYLALVRPYAEGRFAGDEAGKRAFHAAALARKNGLRRDFEAYYADALGQKGFRFEDAAPGAKGARLGPAEAAVVRAIPDLGWQGKTLPIDEDEIEDQNALIFVEGPKGQERTVVRFKVREEANAKVLLALKKGAEEKPLGRIGQALNEDSFAADILAAVKTANHHVGDGKYNKAHIEKARKHAAALRELAKSDDPDVRGMASGYLGWIERVEKSVESRSAVPGGKFAPYLRKHEPAKGDTEDKPFVVRKGTVRHTKRALRHGEIEIEREGATNGEIFPGLSMSPGEQFDIEFPDGVRAVYRPWSGSNLYAQRGEFELVLPDRPDARSVERALERIEALGLKATVATPQDAELMYLQKQAYVANVHEKPEWKAVLKRLDNRGAGKEERIREMRGFWEERLGVEDLTKLQGYDPMGEHQAAFKVPASTAGYRHQYRFDVSDADLDRELPGYGLKHSLTNGEQVSGFIDVVLANNGAMVSTVEKIRVGLKPGGMSPTADMDTGGAAYFFTRIGKVPKKDGAGEVGLYFKKRLLRRMDAVSYDHDAYGRVRDGYVSKRRGSTFAEWREFSKRRGNETILKHSVTLLDNIDVVVVADEAERKKVLDSFGKHGIEKLPDGRRVRDIVLARR
jgi:SPP1 gp7 family putative phage head morphogenesis protein